MRVLDLGCGRALSSIFLRKEFEVEVWAVDLWFSASENLQRIRDADVGMAFTQSTAKQDHFHLLTTFLMPSFL
jgi:cyclopropane fatty-acyl-phospholipid synthase-like methyltransferase